MTLRALWMRLRGYEPVMFDGKIVAYANLRKVRYYDADGAPQVVDEVMRHPERR